MTAKKNAPESDSSVAPIAFEAALGELQDIVGQLETGATSLEESMQQFERGVSLLKSCYRVLENAEQRIEVLTGMDRDGTAQTQPFDAAATFEGAEEAATTATRKSKPRAAKNELPF